ncbi:MAG: VanZ family protein [Bacteroidales bacterium]|nr:VanZ family protein [Bacteroidales bacterium]
MKLNSRRTAATLAIIYVSLVFFCCLYKFSGSENLDLSRYLFGIRLDRYAHFTMFFPYPFVAWLFLHYEKGTFLLHKYPYLAILVSGFLLALAAEASQELLTAYRDTDPYDLIANFTGVTVGTIMVYAMKRPLKKICNLLFGL